MHTQLKSLSNPPRQLTPRLLIIVIIIIIIITIIIGLVTNEHGKIHFLLEWEPIRKVGRHVTNQKQKAE